MNDNLAKLFLDWQISGFKSQEAFDWSSSLSNWIEKFPQHSKFFKTVLTRSLDREAVRGICESSAYDIIEKFLTVMVWGYGDRGYGPYRVGIMLSQQNAREILTETFRIASSGNPKDAYRYLTENRIRNLGPSFGTKFLSFCTPRQIGAPIYDSFVGLWISKYASNDFYGIPMNYENWNCKTYFAYWDWIKEHSNHFDCYPDDLEFVLFRAAEIQFSRNSKREGN